MASPLKLLKNPLRPSRGSNTEIYHLFDLKIGVFDLAGQENDSWFGKEDIIFNQSDMIIIVLDINAYLKDSINFIENINKVYNRYNLPNCKTVILLHKIDLMDPLYLQHKIKAMNEILEKTIDPSITFKLLTTSIAKEFFFSTFDKIIEIFMELSPKKIDFKKPLKLQDLRKDLEIIISYKPGKEYHRNDLVHDFKIPKSNITTHLRRLEKLGFIEFLNNSQEFKLTDRATFLTGDLEIQNVKKSRINKVLECFFVLNNLTIGDK